MIERTNLQKALADAERRNQDLRDENARLNKELKLAAEVIKAASDKFAIMDEAAESLDDVLADLEGDLAMLEAVYSRQRMIGTMIRLMDMQTQIIHHAMRWSKVPQDEYSNLYLRLESSPELWENLSVGEVLALVDRMKAAAEQMEIEFEMPDPIPEPDDLSLDEMAEQAQEYKAELEQLIANIAWAMGLDEEE